MIPSWTEQKLRESASWKAFKDGQMLLKAAAVKQIHADADSCRGTVQAGNRQYKLSVKISTGNIIETRCSCPENQSTGALCAHAIALGLSAILPPQISQSEAKKESANTEVNAQRKQLPLCIQLPSNWAKILEHGKLSATISNRENPAFYPADAEIHHWLEKYNLTGSLPIHINIDGEKASSFLNSCSNHEFIQNKVGHQKINITLGHRLFVNSITKHEESIDLDITENNEIYYHIHESLFLIHENEIKIIGDKSASKDIWKSLDSLIRNKKLTLPTKDFLNHIDVWQQYIQIPETNWIHSLKFIPAPVSFHCLINGKSDKITLQILACYANSTPVPIGIGLIQTLPRLNGDLCEIRNLSAELDAFKKIQSYGFECTNIASGEWTLNGEDPITHFISTQIPYLKTIWTITEDEKFKDLSNKIITITPKIELLGSGTDWLSFNLNFVSSSGIIIPKGDLKKILNLNGARNKDGKKYLISDEINEIIEPLLSELEVKQVNGHYEASKRSSEVFLSLHHRGTTNQDQTIQNINAFDLPTHINANLRPYQLQGVHWMYDRLTNYGGALLADDMGLGKTLQTISIIEKLFDDHPHHTCPILVVATTSLLGNWKNEFQKFSPCRNVKILHGATRNKEQNQINSSDVIITSFGTLSRDLAWHLKNNYLLVCVDEASLMRNPETDHAKAICKLNAKFKLALTGTPVENGVKDLWSIFKFIQPGWLGSKTYFRDQYEVPIKEKISAKSTLDRLKLKMKPFLLRRTKEQVATDLPSKIIIDEYCDLSQDQQSVYKDLLSEARKQVDQANDDKNKNLAKMRVLTALLRLRQTCNDLALLGVERFIEMPISKRSSKTERLMELLEEAISGSHKVLVFSQFQKQLIEIENSIHHHGWKSLRLDGTSKNRQQLVDQFQAPSGPPIFLISLKAGAYGLNLTAADIVIHFDPWWNPAAEAQATDRAHRIGQTKPVTVYRLLTRGTVEEKVVALQSQKKDISTHIDESGDDQATHISISEIEDILTTA